MLKLLKCYLIFILLLNSVVIILVQNLFFAIVFLIINCVIVNIVLFVLELQLVAYFYSVLFVGALAILLIIFLLVATRKWKLFFKNFFLTVPMGVVLTFFFTEIYYIVASPLVEQLIYK